MAVAKGYAHALAFLPDGMAFAWGDNSAVQTDVLLDPRDVIAISARGGRSADLSDGSWQVAGGVAGDGTTRAVKVPKRGVNAEFFCLRRN